ncbi:YciI family protein [Pelagibacterium xiamenense]|uniref:YciI family protein n=1 Tax=Pelagibacterium xiamenense TaxID=2901140 RepID=UPI001E5A758C|nr:YciI family protein [Pelagibacterium xiamenense]MCD7058310.1 YciI family protein [Pelagibacterium xiamenense]
MLFAVSALDKPESLDLRLATRPAHLQFWEENDAALVLAGPYLGADEKPCGSLLVVKAESREAAAALMEKDPYAAAGLFQSIDIRPWNWALKRPEDI